MKKVIITCDSAADLNNIYSERNIDVISLIVNLGTESFFDGDTICPDDIYEYVTKHNELPKTASRNDADFYEFFKKHTDKGYDVVHYSISNEFSLMYNEACKAANKLKGVYVVDSRNLSTGIGLSVLHGCDLRDEGKSAKEIFDLSSARTAAVQASFVLNSVEYLHKGGRCSGTSAFAATALMIKPSIQVINGAMHVGRKYFPCTFEKAVPKYVNDILKTYNTPHSKRIFVTHTSTAPEIVETVKEILRATGKFEEIIETTAGATITSHCGKGTLGILFFNDGQANN